MMSQAGQISSFPHAASRALSLLLENIEMVASKASLRHYETTVASQVQRFHVALAEVSPELAQVAQEILATEHVLSSLHKLIGIGEIRRLSAARRVT